MQFMWESPLLLLSFVVDFFFNKKEIRYRFFLVSSGKFPIDTLSILLSFNRKIFIHFTFTFKRLHYSIVRAQNEYYGSSLIIFV